MGANKTSGRKFHESFLVARPSVEGALDGHLVIPRGAFFARADGREVFFMNEIEEFKIDAEANDIHNQLMAFVQRDLERKYPRESIEMGILKFAIARFFADRIHAGMELDVIKKRFIGFIDGACDDIVEEYNAPAQSVH